MYLSRLILNPTERAVHRLVADVAALHRLVMAGFGPASGAPRADHRILWRLDTDPRQPPRLLVQSKAVPSWAVVDPQLLLHIDDVPNPATKDLAPLLNAIGEQEALVFRLRANATRRVQRGSATERAGSTRVPLRGEAARLAWLHRQAGHHGFGLCVTVEDPTVPDVRVIEEPEMLGWRGSAGQRQRLTFASVLFEGRLHVRDGALFRAAIAGGIGPAKAYGFGLLSVAPTNADH